MMWIKNNKTGHVWYVSEEHGTQLLRNEDFVSIGEPKRQTIDNPNEFEELNVADLKDLAKERGLKGYSNLNRDDLIELLGGE